MEDRYHFNRNRERLGAVLLLGLGLYGYIAIGNVSADSRLFPRATALVIILCAAVIFLRSFLRAEGQDVDDGAPEATIAVVAEGGLSGPLRVAIAFGMSIAYILSVPFLGFAIATPIFMIASAVVFGYRNWLAIGLTTVVYVGFVTFMLRRVFYVLLPEPLLNI